MHNFLKESSMAKNTPTYDDEIDLIELVQVFITHKIKYMLLGLVGLLLGLVFTFQHEPRFETEFKVHVGHPAFSNQSLIFSSGVQEVLQKSELNKKIMPHYSFNKKTELFSVVTEENDASKTVIDLLTHAMREEINNLQAMAATFRGFDDRPVILNNNNNNNNNNLTWTNQDIAKLDPDQVIQSIKISFSDEPKILYPKPLKHGVIGIFIGFILGFVWMLAAILTRQLQSK